MFLNCCKPEITFKCQTRLSDSFRLKELISTGYKFVVYKFQCGLFSEFCYGETIKHIENLRNTGVSPHLLLNRRSNQPITVLFAIIYFTVIMYLLLPPFSLIVTVWSLCLLFFIKFCFWLNDSPSKAMKNIFYFI